MMRTHFIALFGFVAVLAAGQASAGDKTITIGAENDAAPWSYADGTGYVNDLVRAAFQASGWTVKLDVMPYPRCKSLAESGQLAGCFSTSQTAETLKALQFPKHPVFYAENRLYAKDESLLSGCSPDQWAGKITVGLIQEYEYLPAVNKLFTSGQVHKEVAMSEANQLRMLQAHRFDAALVTTDPIKRIDYLSKIANVNEKFKLVCNFGTFPAYLAFSRKHPKAKIALEAFDQGMRVLENTGAAKKLQQDWAQRAFATATPTD